MGSRREPERITAFKSDTQSADAIKLRNEVEGTWKLASYEVHARKPFRFTRRPLGTKPIGMLIYTEDGHMSVQMQKSSKIRFLSGASPHGGFFWEKARAAGHYMAYGGTFEVGRMESQNGESSALVIEHAVQHSLFPNWRGTGQVRIAVLEGERLILRPHALPKILVRQASVDHVVPADRDQGIQYEAVLTWERCKGSQGLDKKEESASGVKMEI